MDLSHILAQAFGLYAVLVSFTVLMNPKGYRRAFRGLVKNRTLTVSIGLGELFLGLMIVLTHNVWEVSWRVIVTAIGWLMILESLAYILSPKALVWVVKKTEPRYMSLGVLSLLVGAVLAAYGFWG